MSEEPEVPRYRESGRVSGMSQEPEMRRSRESGRISRAPEEPEVLRYSGSRELGEEEERPRPHPIQVVLNLTFKGVMWVILAVLLLVWLVLGAVFWIPLLLRTAVIFLFSLVEATLEGKKPTEAGKQLRSAVSFYMRGFMVAVQVVTREELEENEVEAPAKGRLLAEFLWALAVWYAVFLLAGAIHTTPLDWWNWLASISWRETIGGMLDKIGL